MHWGRTTGIALWVLLTGSAGRAQTGGGDLTIWFRSTKVCPSGESFVSKIRIEGRSVKLAAAGDRVDYVVTLDAGVDSSRGRLERQTERGTIAVSEVSGSSCQEVSDALALSVALAAVPRTPSREPYSSPRDWSVAHHKPEPISEPGLATWRPIHAGNVRKEPLHVVDADRSWGARLGAEGSVVFGAAPSALFGGGIFAELTAPLFSASLPSILRLGPRILGGQPSLEPVGSLDVVLAEVKLDLCPVTAHWARVHVAPCLMTEQGAYMAASQRSTSETSVAYWVTLGPSLLFSFEVSRRTSIDLSAAVVAPLLRQDLLVGAEAIARSAPMNFSGGVGLSWSIF